MKSQLLIFLLLVKHFPIGTIELYLSLDRMAHQFISFLTLILFSSASLLLLHPFPCESWEIFVIYAHIKINW